MLNFIKVQNTEEFLAHYNIYLSSFPKEELKSFDILYFHKNSAKHYLIEYQGMTAGAFSGILMKHDKLPFQILFIEYLAFIPEMRGMGLGTATINSLIHKYSQIILEIEPAEKSKEAEKRYNFYDRLGFKILSKDYDMPAQDDSSKPINMWLLLHSKLKPEEIDANLIKYIIQNSVYDM